MESRIIFNRRLSIPRAAFLRYHHPYIFPKTLEVTRKSRNFANEWQYCVHDLINNKECKMANNIEHQDKDELVTNCDRSKMDVTKYDDHKLASNIEPLIKVIRGQQVMLDKDLSTLYGVETKVLNQTVKRNIERFPNDFRFELSKEECLRSQIVTSNGRGGNRYSTYAFTEQGVAMLSSVLRSKTAIEVNIQIMRAFVSMRHFMVNNASVFSRLETMEYHQLEILQHQQDTDKHIEATNKRIDEVFRRLDEGNTKPKQGVFYNGQIYDAYTFVSDLIKSAKKRIILIDNYVDETVLTLLDKREPEVTAVIYTQQISRHFQLDIDRHNAQYAPIAVETFRLSHDRFLCIDDDVYHIGASIKDLGKKWFGFSKMEILTPNELVERINRG